MSIQSFSVVDSIPGRWDEFLAQVVSLEKGKFIQIARLAPEDYNSLKSAANKRGLKLAMRNLGDTTFVSISSRVPIRSLNGSLHAERDMAMVELVSRGETLQSVGEHFSVTRERVRQIVAQYEGDTSERRPLLRVEEANAFLAPYLALGVLENLCALCGNQATIGNYLVCGQCGEMIAMFKKIVATLNRIHQPIVADYVKSHAIYAIRRSGIKPEQLLWYAKQVQPTRGVDERKQETP